jgi:acyl dehydratase
MAGDHNHLSCTPLQARFASHVFAGDTLRIEAWKQRAPDTAPAAAGACLKFVFRATTVEHGKAVLTHAAVEFATEQPAKQQPEQLPSAKL